MRGKLFTAKAPRDAGILEWKLSMGKSSALGSRQAPCRCAFTLIELLLTISLISILVFMIFSGAQVANAASKRAGCVANLKQIGALIGVYAGENNGNWPFFVQIAAGNTRIDNSTYSDSRNRQSGEVISVVGAIAPYIKDNKIFFCPADKIFYNAYKNRNFVTEDTYGSYVTRGRNTIGSTTNPLGLKLGDVAGYAIVSCYFLAIPDSPSFLICHHKDHWPVLFGDGHVVISDKPDWLDLKNIPKVNDNPPNQIKFWRYFDTKR